MFPARLLHQWNIREKRSEINKWRLMLMNRLLHKALMKVSWLCRYITALPRRGCDVLFHEARAHACKRVPQCCRFILNSTEGGARWDTGGSEAVHYSVTAASPSASILQHFLFPIYITEWCIVGRGSERSLAVSHREDFSYSLNTDWWWCVHCSSRIRRQEHFFSLLAGIWRLKCSRTPTVMSEKHCLFTRK